MIVLIILYYTSAEVHIPISIPLPGGGTVGGAGGNGEVPVEN